MVKVIEPTLSLTVVDAGVRVNVEAGVAVWVAVRGFGQGQGAGCQALLV